MTPRSRADTPAHAKPRSSPGNGSGFPVLGLTPVGTWATSLSCVVYFFSSEKLAGFGLKTLCVTKARFLFSSFNLSPTCMRSILAPQVFGPSADSDGNGWDGWPGPPAGAHPPGLIV